MNGTDGPVPVRRAVILGASLDVGNRGVLALAVSLAGLMTRAVGSASVAFHYSHTVGGKRHLPGVSADIEVLNCRMSPKSAPSEHIVVILALAVLHRIGFRGPARRNPWLRSILDADFIGDITGGDSFSDIYGLRRFIAGSLPLLSVILLRRPFVMLPQTYGPFRSRAARFLARAVLRRAERILTRDRNCIPEVEKLASRSPEFCPDVAFTLEALQPQNVLLSSTAVTLSKDPLICGVNVSGLLYMGGYTGRNEFGLRGDYRKLVEFVLNDLLHSTDAKILLVPHVFGAEEQEEIACAKLLRTVDARYPGRIAAIRGPLTERELKGMIGQLDFFLGSRMHACIAALSQSVPAVGLAYSDKFLGVFESAGVGESIIDLRTTENDRARAEILRAFGQRAEIRVRLASKMSEVQAEVRRTFESMARCV